MTAPVAVLTAEQLDTPVTLTLRDLLRRVEAAYDRGMLAAVDVSLDVLRPEPAEVVPS